MAESRDSIVLAGGCFWGVEELLRQIPGVESTEVGYTGGKGENPTYEQVKTGESGHAEAVKIDFNPSQVSLKTLLVDHFFKLHDPTTLNRQGNDVGSQYRSAIFVTNESQREVASDVIKQVEQSGFWKAPVVTAIEDLDRFWSAEDYHQDYLQKNKNGYTCHFYRK